MKLYTVPYQFSLISKTFGYFKHTDESNVYCFPLQEITTFKSVLERGKTRVIHLMIITFLALINTTPTAK